MNKKKFGAKFQKALCKFKDKKGNKAIKLLKKINENPSLYF